jgi:hypothetical protein
VLRAPSRGSIGETAKTIGDPPGLNNRTLSPASQIIKRGGGVFGFRTTTHHVYHLKTHQFAIRVFWVALGIACTALGTMLLTILLR